MTAPLSGSFSASQLRSDLLKPVIIFGGAFLLSAAFCGAVDSMDSSSSGFVEEVKVMRAEGAAGGHDADLLVACKQAHGRALSDVRCRQQRYQTALLH